MWLFSLQIQPLIQRITVEDSIFFNQWYTDHGTMMGHSMAFAVPSGRLLFTARPQGFSFTTRKLEFFGRTPRPRTAPFCLAESPLFEFPLSECDGASFELLGAPIGIATLTEMFLRSKIDSCRRTVKLFEQVRDPRARFHMHRLSASACRVTHVFKPGDPHHAPDPAAEFEPLQRSSYESSMM